MRWKRCIPEGKTLVATKESDVVILYPLLSSERIAPCNHEEADTRLFVNCKNTYEYGYRRILITATDVVILGIKFSSMFKNCFL